VASPRPTPWAVPVEALLAELGARAEGLPGAEAARRLSADGPNELPEPEAPGLLRQAAAQLTHFMALLLWVAGGLAFASRMPELGWAIWAVVLVNGAFSLWQERRAEQALSALRRRLPRDARAWRDGRLTVVPAAKLVRGDVVELAQGDRVPADARLLAAERLRLDLSTLTGESLPVERAPAPAEPLCALAAEAGSAVLAGATVVGGRGRAVVWATGRATALGEVAGLTAGVHREPSTLAVQVARLVRFITALAVGMGLLVFALATALVGVPLAEGLIFAIGIVVANVPEGLLPTVTLALALGVQRMARRQVLVRRLPALETLSAVTVICTDKTGTLTENQMAVHRAWIPWAEAALPAPGQRALPRLARLLEAGALCTEAAALVAAGAGSEGFGAAEGDLAVGPLPGEQRAVARDPLEAALLVAAQAMVPGATARLAAAPRLRELPFDAARRLMTVVVPGIGLASPAPVAIVKGAPSEVLARCTRLLEDGPGSEAPLSAAERAAALAEADRLGAAGDRVLAVAMRPAPAGLSDEALERGLTLLGLLAVRDPPRPAAAATLARCREAGIRVVMVTGDGPATALAVARETGLVAAGPEVASAGGAGPGPPAAGEAAAVTGAELAARSDEALRELLRSGRTSVFARVTPPQKLRLVRAFQALGEVVAVTGDGVNDAPALRAAHVGIAMGASGTDVAREAADLVLLDDELGSVVAAIEEGRALFRNIRKFLAYILTSNVPEVVPFLAMVALRIPPALTILQILAVDLGTDMVPALALGGEPPEPGLMQRPPRPRDAPLLDGRLLRRAYLRLGLTQAAAAMAAFAGVWALHGAGLEALRAAAPAILAHAAPPALAAAQAQATTAALAAIVLCQMGNLFACRSERLSFLSIRGRNPLLAWGLAVEGALLLAVIFVPPLQDVFATAPLPAAAWPYLLLGPLALLAVDEAVKALGRWTARRRARARATSAEGGAHR